jgi:hypothetical protein
MKLQSQGQIGHETTTTMAGIKLLVDSTSITWPMRHSTMPYSPINDILLYLAYVNVHPSSLLLILLLHPPQLHAFMHLKGNTPHLCPQAPLGTSTVQRC